MENLALKICNELSEFSPKLHKASSGSIYISFSGSKISQVRISNHAGHKLKQNVWELRLDAMTTRKKPKNRVYNHKDIDKLISDFK